MSNNLRAVRQAKRQFSRSTAVANRESANTLKAHAQTLMAGTIPGAQIRRDRPFARNSSTITTTASSGRGPNRKRRVRVTARGRTYPLLPINSHTGGLRRSLKVSRFKGGFRIRLGASYAQFIAASGGTRKMVDRTFMQNMNRKALHERAKQRKRVLSSIRT